MVESELYFLKQLIISHLQIFYSLALLSAFEYICLRTKT